jgi:hypothetical protein
MSRCGCAPEDEQQSEHSPGVVQNEEPLVIVTDTVDLTLKSFPNNKLKSGQLSVCRAALCRFDEMFAAVVGDVSAPRIDYKGYFWALANEIRSIIAKRNTSRDKTPHLPPKKVGAFCVIDDGEPDYKPHACLSYSRPSDNFWSLHDTVAARGDLLIAFESRGISSSAATPPFAPAPPPQSPAVEPQDGAPE